MPQKRVMIFGAGISGLVAAINLAKAGFDVTVSEKRDSIGGSPKWHPSVHQQVFDVQKTAKYLDIDISSCFSPVRKHVFYFYGRKSIVDVPANSYVCEKGQRSSSIECFLFKKAMDLGVKFVFGETFNPKNLRLLRLDSHAFIVATGLESEPYKALGVRHSRVQGFRASKTADEPGIALSFFGDYTNQDFAYVASSGDIMFSLLFARRGMEGRNLAAFEKHLLETEGISFDNWAFSNGCVPLETNLVKNGMVLAGTISGMIDPFFFNGLSGALISGKLAAEFFLNKNYALKEFKWFTSNFRIRQSLKSASTKLPLKMLSFPIVVKLGSYLRWVGVF